MCEPYSKTMTKNLISRVIKNYILKLTKSLHALTSHKT